MDLVFIFIGVIAIATVFLNVMATNIIQSSQIHEAQKKKQLIMVLWSIPLLGVFIVIRQINKDIKKNQTKMEEEIAPAMREMADRLKVLDADLRGKASQSSNSSAEQSTKIH